MGKPKFFDVSWAWNAFIFGFTFGKYGRDIEFNIVFGFLMVTFYIARD